MFITKFQIPINSLLIIFLFLIHCATVHHPLRARFDSIEMQNPNQPVQYRGKVVQSLFQYFNFFRLGIDMDTADTVYREVIVEDNKRILKLTVCTVYDSQTDNRVILNHVFAEYSDEIQQLRNIEIYDRTLHWGIYIGPFGGISVRAHYFYSTTCFVLLGQM